MKAFLAEHGLLLDPRDSRRLTRALRRYDPLHPSPEEIFGRIFAPPGQR